MANTWRQESTDSKPIKEFQTERDNEDIDPRSYNVFQRNNQEWDSLRVEKAFSDKTL